MGAFGGLTLTNRGKILQSKAQSGVQLIYTRMALGDGSLGTSSILSLNALIHEVKSLNLTKLKVLGDGNAVVGAVLSNQDLTSGFYFREIGIFATDPDVGEILYCYGNSGGLAEYIPAGGTDIIEKNIDIQTIVGNAANITATIDSSLVWETVDGSQEKADTAESNANAYTDSKVGSITPSNIGAETPDGALQKINNAIGLLINGAPGALDTLKELADAMGDDPNFSTTILNRLTADEQNISTNTQNLTAHTADYVKHPGYATTTGTANTYAVTLNPAPTSYVDGMGIVAKINVASTGASTLSVNGLVAKPIKDSLGNDITSGGLKANTPYTLRYEATSGNFIVQGKGGGGNAGAGDLLSGKTATVDSGQITGTMPNKVGSGTVITPSTADQAIPQGYFGGVVGDGKVKGDANLIAANILSGKSIFGVAGTLTPMEQIFTNNTDLTNLLVFGTALSEYYNDPSGGYFHVYSPNNSNTYINDLLYNSAGTNTNTNQLFSGKGLGGTQFVRRSGNRFFVVDISSKGYIFDLNQNLLTTISGMSYARDDYAFQSDSNGDFIFTMAANYGYVFDSSGNSLAQSPVTDTNLYGNGGISASVTVLNKDLVLFHRHTSGTIYYATATRKSGTWTFSTVHNTTSISYFMSHIIRAFGGV